MARLGCSLLVLLGALSACAREPGQNEQQKLPFAVRVSEALPASQIEIQAPLSGVVTTSNQVQVAFQLNGLVTQVAVDDGDEVVEGQVLATLDSRLFVASRDQAAGSLAAAEANLAMLERGSRPEEINLAQAQLSSAGAILIRAQADHARAQELYAQGVISQQQLDAASSGLSQAEQAVRAAEEQLELANQGPREEQVAQARAGVATARAVLAQAQVQLDYASLKAPTAGTVTWRQLEVGQTVAAGVPVLELSQLNELEVMTELPERDLAQVSVGDIGTITFPAAPGVIKQAEVFAIAPRAQPTTRGFEVQLRLLEAGAEIVPGMVALIEFNYLAPPADVVIPAKCIVDGKVFVVSEGQARLTAVKLVNTHGEYAYVEGLQAGCQVVINGQQFINDGDQVTIVGALGISELTDLRVGN